METQKNFVGLQRCDAYTYIDPHSGTGGLTQWTSNDVCRDSLKQGSSQTVKHSQEDESFTNRVLVRKQSSLKLRPLGEGGYTGEVYFKYGFFAIDLRSN